MTVIAYDGNELACDDVTYYGDTKVPWRKLCFHTELHDSGKRTRAAACASGDAGYGKELVDWLLDYATHVQTTSTFSAIKDVPPERGGTSYSAVAICYIGEYNESGRLYARRLLYLDNSMRIPGELDTDLRYAFGAGRDAAYGALLMGATSTQAVSIAGAVNAFAGAYSVHKWEPSDDGVQVVEPGKFWHSKLKTRMAEYT